LLKSLQRSGQATGVSSGFGFCSGSALAPRKYADACGRKRKYATTANSRLCTTNSDSEKGAEDDVVCDPDEQKPARRIAAAEHKRSAKNRENPHEANPHDVIFKRTLRLELGDVVCKSDDAGCHEYATDYGN
jgi:hypothetical protein